MKNTAEIVTHIIAEHLGLDDEQVTPERSLIDLGADSLDEIEIVILMEDEFGLLIDDEQADKCHTAQDCIELVERLLLGRDGRK